MSTLSIKKRIQDLFRNQSLQLDKEALGLLCDCVTAAEGNFNVLDELLSNINASTLDKGKVTGKIVQAALRTQEGSHTGTELIQVVNAFEVPNIAYEPNRNIFYAAASQRSLHATSKSKVHLYWERLYVLRQRLHRNKMFSKPALEGLSSNSSYVELTDLKALLGTMGETRFVMGFISQRNEGEYVLEDLTAALPIDIQGAATASGLFTDNCIVVAEGEMQSNGRFQVKALGFPPCESRDESVAAAKGLDMFGGTPLVGDGWMHALEAEEAQDEARIVFLSDVTLDVPQTLKKLDTIFAGYEAMEEPPLMFVLIGNFQSVPFLQSGCSVDAVRAAFDALADVMEKYSYLQDCHLVFVPGPNDVGGCGVMPQPPLPELVVSGVKERFPHANFASNPCRIRYCTQQLVVFRYDLQLQMVGNCLLPPTGDVTSPSALFESVCCSLLQQSHMLPLPLEQQPIAWQYDTALRLYPLPDCLILADSHTQAHFVFEDCVCINPGSLSDATFSAYLPAIKQAEPSALPGAG